MKSKTLALIAAMSLGTAIMAHPVRAETTATLNKPVLYIVKDLGTLGGSGGVAEGVSDRSWVVGTSNLSGDQSGHGFVWRDGVMTDLGTLGGPNSNVLWAVKDNRGLIAGAAETTSADPLSENFCPFAADNNPPTLPTGLICRGFVWRNGVMTALPTLGGNNGSAASVNSLSQVAGWAENSTRDPTCVPPQVLDYEAVVWGPTVGEIHALPLIWEHGHATDLGNLGGAQFTLPFAINSKGQVVGQSDLLGDATFHGFIWQKEDTWPKGLMTDLGALPGDIASFAFGLNDLGQVVGGSLAPNGNFRAYLWQNGLMKDLNTLVKPGSTSLYLVFGNDINASGEIAAYASNPSNGEFRAALLIPCDEQHASYEGCADGSKGATATLAGNMVGVPWAVLPQGVRALLLQHFAFGRFGAP
jgi:probable HAF family extracellular repeat protein